MNEEKMITLETEDGERVDFTCWKRPESMERIIFW